MAGELKTPPMSSDARVEGGMLLRRLQRGETLSMPESRPMPTIGPRETPDDVIRNCKRRLAAFKTKDKP